jgi:hypothetical protein
MLICRYINYIIIIFPLKTDWDSEYHTVLPKTMYEYTLNAIFDYPNKKIISHFIQPHFPFIGYKIFDGSFSKLKERTLNQNSHKFSRRYNDSLFRIFSSDIYAMMDKNALIKAYQKNLEITIPYVEKLINVLPGTTVVTADHGEALGEKLHRFIPIKFFGHKEGIKIAPLIEVPWLTIKPKEKDKRQIEAIKEKKLIADKTKELKKIFKQKI